MTTSSEAQDRVAASVALQVRRRILPLFIVAWFIAYIDRFNVSFAALQMNDALGFSAAVYGFGAGIFFVGYSVFEVPSNLILARVGARRWLCRIMVTWGLISAATMFAQGPTSFYLLRFFLGIAEAGCFPGMAYYLSQWLSPRERASALGAISSMAMVSGVLGAPIASGLLALDGAWGLAGWQWLFLIEGIPAVLMGLCILRYLPDGPESVTWLTGEQRTWIRAHAARETVIGRVSESIVRVITDSRYWLWASTFFFATAGGSALRVFQPILLKEVSGLSAGWAAGLTAIPSLAGAAAIVYVGQSATKFDERRWHTAVPLLLSALGMALVGVTYGTIGPLLVASLASVGAASQPPLFASVSATSTGSVNAVGIAFVNSIAALGAFLGPYIVGFLLDSNLGIATACAVAAAAIGVSGFLALAQTAGPRVATVQAASS